MKVIYSYLSNIGRKAISVDEFVDTNRIIEAIKYLDNLRFNVNMANIFNASVEDAIQETVLTSYTVTANAPDFYGVLTKNLLDIIAGILDIEGTDIDLSIIKWWKIVSCLPDNDPAFVTEKVTIEKVVDPKEEALRLLTDLEP